MVGVSLKGSVNIDEKNHLKENNKAPICMISRIFPWLQNNMSSNIHADTKHVKLITEQTKNKNLVQTPPKRTNVWNHIVEKV